MLLISLATVSCTTVGGIFFSNRLDSSPIRILSLDLFDQRRPTVLSQNWKGDWVLRRERLRLIDTNLRAIRPQVISFQNLLAKEGSLSDSDKIILARGSLKGYDWSLIRSNFFEDTRENSSLGNAVLEPITLDKIEDPRGLILGENGFASFTRLYHENSAILLVNVNLDISNPEAWYELLSQQTKLVASELNICASRIIFTGKLPGNTENLSYLSFLNSLELKDSADGFCEQADNCLSLDPKNSFFCA